MPDSEPRYRLLDGDGNIVGSLFEPETGGIELKDTVNDTSLTLDEAGLTTPAVNTENAGIGSADSVGFGPIADNGEFIPLVSWSYLNQDSISISSESFVQIGGQENESEARPLADSVNISNLNDSGLYGRFFGGESSGDGSTGTIRFADVPASETSIPANESFGMSTAVDISGSSAAQVGRLEAKADDSGNPPELRRLTVQIGVIVG